MITLEMIRNRWNRDKVYTRPDFWDDAAETYYRESGTNIWANPHLNDILHQVESEILHGWLRDDELKGATLLDVGCGAGRFSREFSSRGAHVVATDFSPKSIEIAKRLSQGHDIQYNVGSIFDLSADHEYDVIVCSKVLSVACKDAVELRQCLGKLFRAMKPGGKLLSIEPCHTSFVKRVLSMSFADFKRELEMAGFDIVTTREAECIPVRMGLAFFEFPHWFTAGAFKAGELLSKLSPITTDQKFLLAETRESPELSMAQRVSNIYRLVTLPVFYRGTPCPAGC